MNKFTYFLFLLIALPILAGLYGAIHDQVTYTISPEYFTKFKYGQFGFDPEWFGGHRQTVAVIGFLATWWTGLPIAIILGIAGRSHVNMKTLWITTMKSILITMLITAIAGVMGYFYGFTLIDENLNWDFPADLIDKHSFILVGAIHNFSYLGGVVGLVAAGSYQFNRSHRDQKINKSAIERNALSEKDTTTEQWYQAAIRNNIEKYGDVPPPWIFAPDSHPYSIQWRMGGGETHIMVFSKWFDDNCKSELERITYFKKYPAPPRWLGWMADAIWDLEPWNEEDFDYTPYFTKLKLAGFEGTDDYERDLNDERWVKNGIA